LDVQHNYDCNVYDLLHNWTIDENQIDDNGKVERQAGGETATGTGYKNKCLKYPNNTANFSVCVKYSLIAERNHSRSFNDCTIVHDNISDSKFNLDCCCDH
jgi:hypothetical protein